MTPATHAARAAPHDGARAIAAVVAALCAALGGFIALHHPIAPTPAALALLAWTVLSFAYPAAWLAVLPAALPVAGLATWSGWLVCEEWDLVALGAACGAYAAWARNGRATAAPDASARTGGALRIAAGIFLLSALVALYRGIDDAGPPLRGWFEGYYEALNSVRVLRGLAYAVLLAPLLGRALRSAPQATLERISLGLCTGGALASLVVLWERAAFPGLLDFSSDYRVTGPFWEMHVGGAALDGWLALCMPFAVRAVLVARTPLARIAACAATALIAYACLVTFSRGVYLAIPVSLAAIVVLRRARRAPDGLRTAPRTLVMTVVSAIAAAALSYAVFRTGGYRALGALLGALVLLVLLPAGQASRAPRWAVPLTLGVVGGGIVVALAWLVPKGVYGAYAVLWMGGVIVAWNALRGALRDAWPARTAFVGVLVAAVGVAGYWGGLRAAAAAALAGFVLVGLAVQATRSTAPVVGGDWRARIAVLAYAGLIAATVAVLAGGAYMSERFASGATDLQGRIAHWRAGLSTLHGAADWSVGKGLGRFPANYFFGVRETEFPGSYQLEREDSGAFVRLSGPRYPAGFGELLRLSQRVHPARGAYVVLLDARATQDAVLHVEICEKHLLYNAHGCAIRSTPVAGTGAWQHLVVPLDGRNLGGGSRFAPRLAFFSLAVDSTARAIDIDNVTLTGPQGGELLANGDFGDELARWFFTSDRFHLPWHIKSLPLNWLYDQGALGLAAALVVVLGVLVRLVAGRAARHPFAPYLAAALLGFLVVGLFDSLVDVPRLALMFYLLVWLAISLPATAQAVDSMAARAGSEDHATRSALRG